MATSSLKSRYVSGMVLSGVGDALGYKNGSWEFSHSGKSIHEELEQLGGLSKIHVKLPNWMVSDDTVMHLATADALMSWGQGTDKEKLYQKLAKSYKLCMRDMAGRAPGLCSTSSCHQLKPDRPKGYCIPFNPRGGGCGAAMRAMCIGLRYPRPEEVKDLIAVSVEAGRMTHHHPTGYLGSFAAALFTAYSVQGKPLREWGRGLLDTLPQALNYITERGEYVKENTEAWDYFSKAWTNYLTGRQILEGTSEPVFPAVYGIKERDVFYKSLSYSGWGGSSGHDAPMIAYDALLSSSDWEELCSRSMFHSGDSDSTGVIAACCYGVMHGFQGVPELNHKNLEYRSRLVKAGETLYSLSHTETGSADTAPTVSVTMETESYGGHDGSQNIVSSPSDSDVSGRLTVPELPSVPSDNDLSDVEDDDSSLKASQNTTVEGLSARLDHLKEDV